MWQKRVDDFKIWAKDFWHRCKVWGYSEKNSLVPIAIFIVGLFTALFIFVTAVLPRTGDFTTHTAITGEKVSASKPLQEGRKTRIVEQVITSDEYLSGFGFQVGVHGYNKMRHVVLRGQITDNVTGEVLTKFTQKFPKVTESDTLEVKLDRTIQAPSGEYKISFKTDERNDGLSLATYLVNGEANRSTINGVMQKGSLLLDLYRPSEFIMGYFWFLAIPIILLLPGLWYIIFVKKAKWQNVFLLAASVLGFLTTFVMVPYSMYDSAAHTNLTFYYASRILGGEPSVEGMWQKRAEDSRDGFNPYAPKREQFYHIQKNFFKMEKNPGRTVEEEVQILGQSYQYAPQIAGVTIARLLGFGQVPTLYMGNLFSLAVYIAIMYCTIRIVPFKPLFTIIGLIPSIMAVAGGYSYDTSINYLSFFFIGYILYLCYDKRQVTVKDILILGVVGIVLAPLKFIYIPLLLLPLMIPKEKWKHPAWKRVFVGVLVAGSVLILVLLMGRTIVGEFTRDLNETPWKDSEGGYTYKLFLVNTVEFIRLFTATGIDKLGEVLLGITQPAHTQIPLWACCAVGLLIVLSVLPAKGESPLAVKGWQKAVMGILSFIVYSLASLAALSWTPVGAYYIKGIQGRYFLPLFPLIALLFYGVLERKKNNDRFLVYSACLMNVYSILYIFQNGIFNRVALYVERLF